jgi:hypothetical protein
VAGQDWANGRRVRCWYGRKFEGVQGIVEVPNDGRLYVLSPFFQVDLRKYLNEAKIWKNPFIYWFFGVFVSVPRNRVARLIVKVAREVSKHRAHKKGPELLPGLAHLM